MTCAIGCYLMLMALRWCNIGRGIYENSQIKCDVESKLHVHQARYQSDRHYSRPHRPNISSPWIWKGVSGALQSGRYTLSYPRGRYSLSWFAGRWQVTSLTRYSHWWPGGFWCPSYHPLISPTNLPRRGFHLRIYATAITKRLAGVVLMLGHRRRRWPSIKTTPVAWTFSGRARQWSEDNALQLAMAKCWFENGWILSNLCQNRASCTADVARGVLCFVRIHSLDTRWSRRKRHWQRPQSAGCICIIITLLSAPTYTGLTRRWSYVSFMIGQRRSHIFRRHNLTYIDVRLWRLKSDPALKEFNRL